MADQRRHAGSSGTEGGKDVEPLRGGMDEIEHGDAGPRPERPGYAGQENERETPAKKDPPGQRETPAKKDPPSPYHDVKVSEGGLTPQAMPGEGTTPERPSGEIEATAGRKIPQERGELENEAANTPRRDPSSRGNEP